MRADTRRGLVWAILAAVGVTALKGWIAPELFHEGPCLVGSRWNRTARACRAIDPSQPSFWGLSAFLVLVVAAAGLAALAYRRRR